MRKMKWFIVIGLMACAGTVVCLVARSSKPTIQRIGFAGLTNGVVGTMAPLVSSMGPSHAANVRAWLAGGTNGAMFTVTNHQSFPIDVVPFGRMYTNQNDQARNFVPLLNVSGMQGLSLQPGQSATVQVALLPHHGPWKVELYYRSDSRLKQLLDSLTRGRIDLPGHGGRMESDWIEK